MQIRNAVPTLLVLLLIGLAACPAAARSILPEPRDFQPLFNGVDLWRVELEQPDFLKIFIVRVDLRAQWVQPLVTPDNGSRPLELDAARTSSFAEQYDLQLAINGDFFAPFPIESEGEPCDVAGAARSRGVSYSPDVGFPALLLRDGRAELLQPPMPEQPAGQLISGRPLLVWQGKSTHPLDLLRQPRTAVGLDRAGRTLYLVVVDGRQPGYSVGLRLTQMARLMLELGCYSALNLDGGGSSTLVICSAAGTGCRALNSPSGHRGEGGERIVGNHLGFFAAPVGGPKALKDRTIR
ncbi:MAG: phosphodiester glycosidase family protein [Candidatus Alcyoniella australis]|nr:phosphodiester glycosidase family protein [Candidatus Alcyoniella australis]